MDENVEDKKRRQFISYSSLGLLGAVLAGGIALSPFAVAQEMGLRPPGALDEKDFLGHCIKCGQCLQVCPYHSIKLSDFGMGHGIGTPYIDPRDRGCYACEALPCVLACPSGALDHAHVSKPSQALMGIAVLVSVNRCLGAKQETVPKSFIEMITNDHPHTDPLEIKMLQKLATFEDTACTLCADMCPLENASDAIEMVAHKDGGYIPLVKDACIGCGVCQELCPAQEAAIIIKPRVTYIEQYGGQVT
jgi:ferredoxin-type protein NapG